MDRRVVYWELDALDVEKEIWSRFRRGEFPGEDFPYHAIANRCLKQEYQTADEVLADMVEMRPRYGAA